MPDPFAYVDEVLEQRQFPGASDGRLFWFFKRAIAPGESIVCFCTDAFGTSASVAARLFFPDDTEHTLDIGFNYDAVHSAYEHSTELGFEVPTIMRGVARVAIPADSYLFDVHGKIFSGHAFTGLPTSAYGETYSDGIGLAKRAHEHYLRFEESVPGAFPLVILYPAQAPEGVTPQIVDLAQGAPAALAIESTEARHWRQVGAGFEVDYESAALTSGRWAFIGVVVASTGSRAEDAADPYLYPELSAEPGWNLLPGRYARPYLANDPFYRVVEEPPDFFGVPSAWPFYQEVTGLTPRQFFGTLSANWRAGVLFIAYRLSPPGGGLWPFNLRTTSGFYYRASCDAGGHVWVRRARSGQPPFDLAVQVTSEPDAVDARPALLQFPNERLFCVWERVGQGVMQAYSDDDGATWSAAEGLMEGARFPFPVLEDNSGNSLVCWYLAGLLQGVFKPHGEDPRAPRTFTDDAGTPLAVAEDTFGLVWHDDDQSRLILTCHIDGEDDPSEWLCTDGGEYCRFQRVSA